MENQFYRNADKNPAQNIIKKPGFINKKVLILLLLIPVLLFILFNNKGVWQRYKLEREQKQINEMIKSEEEKHKQYQDEIQALKTDKSKIEKVAREKYNMKRPGETIYKRKDNKTQE
jgi:cell division protein FtsB